MRQRMQPVPISGVRSTSYKYWKIVASISIVIIISSILIFAVILSNVSSYSPPGPSDTDSKHDANTSYQSTDCEPRDLSGELRVNIVDITMEEVEESLSYINLRDGGLKVPDCEYKSKIAIIIPFRNRESQLRNFLLHMHPILHRQNIYYRIIISEQNEGNHFNRAKLFNSAYHESLFLDDFDCYIFHDIDFLLANDNLMYTCDTIPKHLSVAASQFDYQMPFNTYFGGVVALPKHQFEQVNGFSNCYESWGGEDDDFYIRITSQDLAVTRPRAWLGTYISNYNDHVSDHVPELREKNWYRLGLTKQNYLNDGLNSLNLHVLSINHYKLYTRILFDISYDDYCHVLYKDVELRVPPVWS